jgi:hypothetical protein
MGHRFRAVEEKLRAACSQAGSRLTSPDWGDAGWRKDESPEAGWFAVRLPSFHRRGALEGSRRVTLQSALSVEALVP